MNTQTGTLYIVATPIGNLKDITLRALEVLKSVDMIAAEDTRQTRKLLAHFDIHTPLTSYFEHNSFAKGPYIIGLLRQGKQIAVVSDSGTPGICDPGYRLIEEAKKQGIALTVIPGPSALVAALVASGMPTDRFAFEGYLPVKANARKRRIAELAEETRTVIFYESPHRFMKSLQDFADILGEREIAVARELTKKFEEVVCSSAKAMLERFRRQAPRGEFVIVIRGKGK